MILDMGGDRVRKRSTAMACDWCGGKGWRLSKTEWPRRCPCCDGRGRFTFYALGKRLDVDPKSLRRIYEMGRPKSATAVRCLDRLISAGLLS